jgi:hypothetical protein
MMRMKVATHAMACCTKIVIFARQACIAIGCGKVRFFTTITKDAWHLEAVMLWVKVMAVAVAFGAQIVIWAVHAFIAVTISEGPLSASITVNAFWASPSIMFWMHLMTFAMAFKTQVEVWTFEALVALI